MPVRRDYKPVPRKKSAPTGVRILGWSVVSLTLVGAGAIGWSWWQSRHPLTAQTPVAATPVVSAPAVASAPVQDTRSVRHTTAPTPQPAEKSRFSFYQDLQNRQVTIPEDEIGPTGNKPPNSTLAAQTIRIAPQTAPTPTATAQRVSISTSSNASGGGNGFAVQAGSFSTQAQAERVRANLALLGISAHTEKGRDASGNPIYRVRTGPIRDEQAIQSVRQRLSANGFDSSKVRLD